MGLAEQGQRSLYEILAEMWTSITPAKQMVCTVIALIPKESDAWRPIALLHMVYRWWAKMLRPQLAAWEALHGGGSEGSVSAGHERSVA